MENLACYIIRASFSQERMTYVQEVEQVVYQSKDGQRTKVFDALEWLAAMCPIKASRWCVTMDITLTYLAAGAKNTEWIIRYLAS